MKRSIYIFIENLFRFEHVNHMWQEKNRRVRGKIAANKIHLNTNERKRSRKNKNTHENTSRLKICFASNWRIASNFSNHEHCNGRQTQNYRFRHWICRSRFARQAIEPSIYMPQDGSAHTRTSLLVVLGWLLFSFFFVFRCFWLLCSTNVFVRFVPMLLQYTTSTLLCDACFSRVKYTKAAKRQQNIEYSLRHIYRHHHIVSVWILHNIPVFHTPTRFEAISTNKHLRNLVVVR